MFWGKSFKDNSRKSVSSASSEVGKGAHTGVKRRALRSTLSTIALVVVFVVGAPLVSHAAQLGLLLTLPSIFDGAILVVALVALLGAVRVYGSVKGGLLAKSWQFFVIGLICLVLAQLFQLANTAGYFQAPELLRPVTLAAMAGLFLLGVLKARRTLS